MFSRKAVKAPVERKEDMKEVKKEFIVDNGDNYIFKEIQVEDISSLIRPETIWYDDSDMMVYRAASMVEEKRVKVTHKEDENLVFDCKNITEFKGRGKKIGDNTVLGLYNVDRELKDLPPYKAEDFNVEPYQIIQGGDEEKAFESAKIQILRTLKETRLQYKLNKIIPVLGEGACFREFADQAKLYKSNRAETLRPILLKRLRKWLVDEVGAVDTKDLRHKGKPIECDDQIEMFAAQGVAHFRKHGWYNIGVISKDKDATNSAKLLINNDKVNGKLKFPKAMHIQSTDKCAGDVVLLSKSDGKSKDFKFYGFKGLMYQSFLGIDSADFYSALKHLDRGFDFGDVSAYKVLKPCKTAKEALQASIDVFSELLPNGVQYTNHKGEDLNVDTMTYMNTYFLTAYMIRKLDDPMDFFKLCKTFKVDTSAITNNHVEKIIPLQPEQAIRESITNYDNTIEEMITLLSDKSGKVADKNARKDQVLEILSSLKGFDEMFDKTAQPVIIPENPKGRTLQEVIDQYNTENGYDSDPEGDYECFAECLSKGTVQEETSSEHRWYDIRDVVHEVVIDGESRYFSTFTYHITGDTSARDMGLDLPTMRDVVEVFPKEVKITQYC